MDIIKKHVDTMVVLGGILSSILWMNHQFNELKQDILIIKTVLIMKNIMPDQLCAKPKEAKQS